MPYTCDYPRESVDRRRWRARLHSSRVRFVRADRLIRGSVCARARATQLRLWGSWARIASQRVCVCVLSHEQRANIVIICWLMRSITYTQGIEEEIIPAKVFRVREWAHRRNRNHQHQHSVRRPVGSALSWWAFQNSWRRRRRRRRARIWVRAKNVDCGILIDFTMNRRETRWHDKCIWSDPYTIWIVIVEKFRRASVRSRTLVECWFVLSSWFVWTSGNILTLPKWSLQSPKMLFWTWNSQLYMTCDLLTNFWIH